MAERNIDVAKESTSQEILDKVSSQGTYTNIRVLTATDTTSEETEMVSIAGKGKLYSFLTKITQSASGTKGSPGITKVFVDGNCILNAKLTPYSSRYLEDGLVYMINSSAQMYTQDDTNNLRDVLLGVAVDKTVPVIGGGKERIALSGEEQIINGSSSFSLQVATTTIEGCIPFKESVKVLVNNTQTGATGTKKCYLAYSLDE